MKKQSSGKLWGIAWAILILGAIGTGIIIATSDSVSTIGDFLPRFLPLMGSTVFLAIIFVMIRKKELAGKGDSRK